MDMLETDGPYEGATCAVTANSGFRHANNSQVRQWNATVEFYRTLKEKYGTYLTVPDPYCEWSKRPAAASPARRPQARSPRARRPSRAVPPALTTEALLGVF